MIINSSTYSTVGVGGDMQSNVNTTLITLMCVVENTTWMISGSSYTGNTEPFTN